MNPLVAQALVTLIRQIQKLLAEALDHIDKATKDE